MSLVNLISDSWENITILNVALGIISSFIGIMVFLQFKPNSQSEEKKAWKIVVFIIIIMTVIILYAIGYIHIHYNNLSGITEYTINVARQNYKVKNQLSISGELVKKREIVEIYYDKTNSSSKNNMNNENANNGSTPNSNDFPSGNSTPNTNNSMPDTSEQDSSNNKPANSETGSHNPNAIDLNTNSDKPQTDDLEKKPNLDQAENSDQLSEAPTLPDEDYSIKISYTIIPLDLYITDENMRITATTSPKASEVILTVEPTVYDKTYNMHSSNQTDWFFKANFDTPGTYTITATAYFEGGKTKFDSFSISYPFY